MLYCVSEVADLIYHTVCISDDTAKHRIIKGYEAYTFLAVLAVEASESDS